MMKSKRASIMNPYVATTSLMYGQRKNQTIRRWPRGAKDAAQGK